jgi:hypothetical protein
MAKMAQHSISELVEQREWSLLLNAVRASPSQELASALQEALDAEQDRAAQKELKKLLFLLRRAGFEPVSSSAEASEPAFPKTVLPTVAMMSCSDPSGANLVLIAKPKDFMYSTLTASVHPVHGVLDAACSSVSDAHLPALTRNFSQRLAGSLETAEVSENLVLWKLLGAISSASGSRTPTAIAPWRSVIEAATEWHDYPTVEPAEMDSAERQELCYLDPVLSLWRLELGAASPFIAELSEILRNSELSKEQVAGLRKELAIAKRVEAWSESALSEHENRIRDLLLIRTLNQQAESAGKIQSLLDDLREKGPESDYAIATYNKTFSHLLHSLQKNSGSKPN